jgi:predicted DNA-binding protein
MAKSISVIPKKRSRPATGRDPAIPVRLPPEMVEQLEELASRRKTTRSQVIRELLEKALKRSK